MENTQYMFRDLRADEIDCRVAQIKKEWLTLLLYKDARVDMDILDETVTPMNWRRKHTRDNANCIIEIWDNEKKDWVGKEDTGTESFSEAQKGLASDSFKRAGFNWGIGRELYTAPFIFVPIQDEKGYPNFEIKISQDGKKISTKTTFSVAKILIENKRITGLAIKNNKGKIVYIYTEKGKEEK